MPFIKTSRSSILSVKALEISCLMRLLSTALCVIAAKQSFLLIRLQSRKSAALLLGKFLASSIMPSLSRTSVKRSLPSGACNFNWLVALTSSFFALFHLLPGYGKILPFTRATLCHCQAQNDTSGDKIQLNYL